MWEASSVKLVWTNPQDAFELSYLDYTQNPSFWKIRITGEPYIAANAFDAKDLKLYEGYYLTSITTPIASDYPGELELAIVVYQDEKEIVSQNVVFINNSYNTFKLDNPVLIEAGKDMKFGIKVLNYNVNDLIATYQQTANPTPYKSDLYSEDDDKTWISISEEYGKDQEVYNLNWEIIGNVTEANNPEVIGYNNDLLGYNIYRNREKINDVIATYPYFNDINAVDNACYTVIAYYSNGTVSEMSEEYCIGLLSIENSLTNENSFMVFPNPAVNIITIQGQFTKAVLMDMNGRIVLQSSENNINVSTLAEGIYFIRIETSQGNVTQKLMIRK